MKYNPKIHHRRSIRLQNYDYSQAGAYFVTICVQERVCLFGDVVDGAMQVGNIGRIISVCWAEISDHFPTVDLDAFVIMPNHVHGIIVLRNNVASAVGEGNRDGRGNLAPTAAGVGAGCCVFQISIHQTCQSAT